MVCPPPSAVASPFQCPIQLAGNEGEAAGAADAGVAVGPLETDGGTAQRVMEALVIAARARLSRGKACMGEVE
jgi:hypothetical protein